jgi:hypothetical protein
VLFVTEHAFLPGFVKADFSPQQARVKKIVTSKALVGGYALPRFMTPQAVFQIRMGSTQRSGLRSFVVVEKPA